MPRIAGITRDVILSPDDIEPERAIYRAVCRIGAALTIGVSVPVNLWQGLPVIISVAAFVFGAFCLWLNYEAGRGRPRPALFLIAAILTLNAVWFPNAGSHGSVLLLMFPVLLLPLIFYRGLLRWMLTGLFVVNFMALLAFEVAWPAMVTPFRSDVDRLVDLFIGILFNSAMLAMAVGIVLSRYEAERRQLQFTVKALAASEAQSAAIFHLNPDSVCLIDPETREILDANEGFERISGWQRAEVIGRTSDALGLWPHSAERDEFYRTLATEGRVGGAVWPFQRRDGAVQWQAISAAVVDWAGCRAILVTARDVTEEREANRQAAESRSLIESLVNSAGEMVWLADPATHRLLLFNESFRQYFKDDHGLEVRVGLGPDESLPPAVAATWHGLYNRALHEGPYTIEYTTASHRRILLLSFTVVRHEDRVIGVSVFGKDVTEQRRADQRQAKLELEVLHSQKMESLGSLAGGVAHDFNNMLDGIMGYADLLLDDETDPARLARIQAILRAAARSSELTRKLLAFARRGKNIVEAVDLKALVTESLGMVRPALSHGVGVVSRFNSTWTVDGDPSQLSQVVVNLCINASEAMVNGGALQVSTADLTADRAWAEAHRLPEGEYVELQVADTGVGMADDVKARIFEPFFTTKADGQLSGTGLGLATVYGVVQLHRGAIAVESTPGVGTTFTVWFPRGIMTPAVTPVAAPATGGQGLVLVVEDEELLRSLHVEMLEKIGYTAVAVADGAEAMEVFASRHTELTAVLLDLKMPRKDGRQTFLEMTAIDARVPVLICSGFGDNEEAQGLITLGARGLLAKPFRLSGLAAQLQGLSQRDRPHSPEPAPPENS